MLLESMSFQLALDESHHVRCVPFGGADQASDLAPGTIDQQRRRQTHGGQFTRRLAGIVDISGEIRDTDFAIEFADHLKTAGADRDGRVGIEWGLYGVPETYVVSADGRVMLKYAGPLTEQILDGTFMPLIERLRRTGDGRPS